MKKYAVIVAGGSGQRMGTATPKQFLLLKGKALLQHTILAFASTYNDIEFIIVLPEMHMDYGKKLVNDLHLPHVFHFAKGGQTRFHSVQYGLAYIEQSSIVFVHDAVRCLVSKNLIQRCYDMALKNGMAIPAVTSTDSIRMVTEKGNEAIDRNNIKIIQTPQTFSSEILLQAFERPYSTEFTDEATVAELNGNAVFLVEGEYSNIKVTHPSDLIIAEQILRSIIS